MHACACTRACLQDGLSSILMQHLKLDLAVSCPQKLRKQREATKARKEENRKKSLVTQKISNPATLKRMMASKKGRKKLVTVDTVKVSK